MLPIVVIPFPLRVVGNRVREIGIRRGHGAAVGIFLLGHVLSRGRGGDFELTRGGGWRSGRWWERFWGSKTDVEGMEDSLYMLLNMDSNGLGRGCFIHLHDSSKVSWITYRNPIHCG